MIIGISGYIGSGKDTVAKMIQWSTSPKKFSDEEILLRLDDISHLGNSSHHAHISNWEIKKFAGKLKQMVCLLTGISIEDLEKPEVKNSQLGEEWNYDKLQIVDHPTKATDYVSTSMTVRELLQKLGTEAVRNQVHPNAWVNALMVDYQPTGEFNHIHDATIYPNWIITDCRFPNEAQAIKDRGGIVVRVNRVGTIMVSKGGGSIPVEEKFNPNDIHHVSLLKADNLRKHPSETSLDSWEFDYTIDNSGDLSNLLAKTKEMLKHFNL